MSEKVILESRWKLLLLFAGCAGFVAAGIWMLNNHPEEVHRGLTGYEAGWLSIVFFGVGALVSAVQLVRPSRLILFDQGFRIERFLFRPKTVAWSRVGSFEIQRSRSAKWVAYTLNNAGALEDVASSSGASGTVGRLWEMSPEALMDLLNQYRAAAVSGHRA